MYLFIFINSNFVYTEDILDEKKNTPLDFIFISFITSGRFTDNKAGSTSQCNWHTHTHIYISSFTTSQFSGNVNSAVLISVWYIFCKVLFQNYHYLNWFNLIEVEFSFKNLKTLRLGYKNINNLFLNTLFKKSGVTAYVCLYFST